MEDFLSFFPTLASPTATAYGTTEGFDDESDWSRWAAYLLATSPTTTSASNTTASPQNDHCPTLFPQPSAPPSFEPQPDPTPALPPFLARSKSDDSDEKITMSVAALRALLATSGTAHAPQHSPRRTSASSLSPRIRRHDTSLPPTLPPQVDNAITAIDNSSLLSGLVNSDGRIECWDHGCNGRSFSTRGNLIRHCRERAEGRREYACGRCGAGFSRSTARDQHVAKRTCHGEGYR